MARTITFIPSKIDPVTRIPLEQKRKRRVAAYARVSTDSEEQLNSYKNQVAYYELFINEHPQWEFVKVYTDEGISGTNVKKREGFKQMVADALDGKIDLIITKSISRFARNTVDFLVYVRELRQNNVEVYFETENIYSFDPKCDLLITILSSLAQNESLTISKNIKWAIQRKHEEGKFSLPYRRFLGYEKGEDGFPKIVPEEAEIVLMIYEMFAYGKTPGHIAKYLTELGIPTPGGRVKWRDTTVESILTNEKYCGCAILQKTISVDFLQKTRKINEGEEPQFYVKDCHEAIITPDVFDEVQSEMKRRKSLGRKYSGESVLSGKIRCGDCGEDFGPKVWNSNSKYRRVIWQCNKKFKNKCKTPHVTEELIKEMFIKTYNEMYVSRDRITADAEIMIEVLTGFDYNELVDLQQELDIVNEMIRRHINDNAHKALNQEAYLKKYNSLSKKAEKLNAKIEALKAEFLQKEEKAKEMERFIKRLMSQNDKISQFDERLWLETVDYVTVFHDGRTEFHFKNGVCMVAA